MKFLRRLLSAAVLALLASACSRDAAVSAAGAGVPPVAAPAQGSPAETFMIYIEALRANNFDLALSCLYLPSTNKLEVVKQGFAPLAEKIRAEKWNLRIETTGEQGRFAAIIYSTNAEMDDHEPVLAVRDNEGKWKLHHRGTSGGLRNLFTGKDYDTAMRVVKWGREQVNEAKVKAAARKDKEKAAAESK
jgi:hypothetical protein